MPASPPNKAAAADPTGTLPAPVEAQSPLIGFRLLLAVTLFMLLSLAEQVPALGIFRPTLLLTLVLIGISIANFARIKHRLANPAAKSVTGLALYILLTFPLAYWPGSVLGNLPHLIISFGYFYFIAIYVDSVRRLEIFLAVYTAAQVFRVLAPLFLHVTTGYWGDKTYLGDDTGFIARLAGAPWDIINANGLASLVAITVPFLYFWGRSRGPLTLMAFVMPLSLVLIYALMLTLSRSTLLALCLEAFAVLMFSKRRILILGFLFVGLTVGVASLSPLQKERFLGSMYRSDAKGSESAKGRVSGITDDIEVWAEHPFFGYGFGTSGEALFNFKGGHTISHTLYTEALMEIGVFGIPFLLAYLFNLWKAAMQTYRLSREHESQLGFAPILVWNPPALLVWLIGYTFFSIFSYGLSTYSWYLYGGIIVATKNIIDDVLKLNAPKPVKSLRPVPGAKA
ncbi:MAG TPA: O-antigen ligase family protein [Steroidobacteraceae bacterium]|nr:O-antigen ligase family protein [Steroidobacteraceae bacterium]